MRKLFVIGSAKELKAVNPKNINIEEILLLIEDILWFFEDDETDEYKTN